MQFSDDGWVGDGWGGVSNAFHLRVILCVFVSQSKEKQTISYDLFNLCFSKFIAMICYTKTWTFAIFSPVLGIWWLLLLIFAASLDKQRMANNSLCYHLLKRDVFPGNLYIICLNVNRDLKQTTTTATRTSPNKMFNEQTNSFARVL